MRRFFAVMFFVATTAGTAFALNQGSHASITQRTCEAAGFTHDFCERVGDEAYNTDYSDFDLLVAHAMPETGESACTAAGKTMQRLLDLGREARAALREVKADPNNHELSAKVAKAVGRALHTIEDNCAHEGMPNPQHAWYSLSDSCEGTTDSPDVQVQARACAEREAGLIFTSLAQAASQIGVDRSTMVPWEVLHRWPPRGGICAFLRLAPSWDGKDRRWNNAVVVPAFRGQLTRALTSDTAALDQVCTNGETLARASYDPVVDTSRGNELSCLKIDAFCVGKSDAADEAPPWDEADPESTSETGGCDSGGGESGPLLMLLIVVSLIALNSASRLPRSRRECADNQDRARSRK